MTRSILAVIAGYGVFLASTVLLFGVSGVDPHAPPSVPFVIFAAVYGMAVGAVAGFVTAAVASRKPFLHAAIVASIIWVISVASVIARFSSGSIWSELVTIFLIAPMIAAAGFARERPARSTVPT